MSELPREWYWGVREAAHLQERVVFKRLWWKLWRRCRVRQELRRTSRERGIRGSVSWGWVDVEILPDLPEAKVRDQARR